jgi:hypothetical protein
VNQSFIGLHTQQEGSVKVRLPASCVLYDVYRDQELPESASFEVPVEPFQTYLLYRGSRQSWAGLRQVE